MTDLKPNFGTASKRMALPAIMFAKYDESNPPSGFDYAVSLKLTPACLRIEEPRVIRNLVCARDNYLVIYNVCLTAEETTSHLANGHTDDGSEELKQVSEFDTLLECERLMKAKVSKRASLLFKILLFAWFSEWSIPCEDIRYCF